MLRLCILVPLNKMISALINKKMLSIQTDNNIY